MSFEKEPFYASGTNVMGEFEIRSAGSGERLPIMPGAPIRNATPEDIRRAAALGRNLGELTDRRETRRLSRATHAFASALTQRYAGERIHQLVRAIDALTRADAARDFGRRCALFVGEDSTEICRQLYVMRSNVEHFRDHDENLPAVPLAKARLRLAQRVAQAEALARHCMSRLIARKELWRVFSEDEAPTFWAKPFEEQQRIWGEPLRLNTIEFHPEHVSTDQ
jgi:hypothetical protein